MNIFSLVQTALELGFQYALVAMALFLSYRVLDIADLTTDGCFVLGCAVSVTLTAAGHPFLAIPAAMLAGACAGAGPEGLDIREFSCGETGYDRDSRLLKRPAQAVCTACLYAVTEPGGAFLDFEVRGESHQ